MNDSPEKPQKIIVNQWIPVALCTVSALSLASVGVFAAFIQMVANMNLRLENPSHCLIFLEGWVAAGTCFFSAYRLIKKPSYRNLWLCVLSGVLIKIDFWLYSLPSARGLIH